MGPGLVGIGIKAAGSHQPSRRAPAPLERTQPQRPGPIAEAAMLCRLHLQPPCHGALAPWVGPVRTLWPQPSVLFAELERELRWEMERAQELMSSFQQLLAGGGSSNPSRGQEQSTSMTLPQGVDGAFTVCQDVKGFDPNDLMVKLVGRKVLLTGKKEMQSEDGKGSFSYKYEVFKREWDVPEGVDPDGLTCSISSEGQLRIEAPRQALIAAPERNVPIQITPAGSAEAGAVVGSEEGANGRAKA
ncbi:PREDICTED: heat shock protein beta-11-like [Gavialis gangeticus]|uniref:heat shock protein beta-11-like n=1 Tax=Gavialis gangeticus TaxID=94835 RepID=UPI00092E5B7C|nr:PREDICTED: heat shock protein beta-11-like [Gavialis gangeticus]